MSVDPASAVPGTTVADAVEAVKNAIDLDDINAAPDFAVAFARYCLNNAERIVSTAAGLVAIADADHWVLIDEMKGTLGAAAANEASSAGDAEDEIDQDDAAQEGALADAEEWVSSTLSQQGIIADVAMALWLRGSDGVVFLEHSARKTHDVA